MARVAVIVPVLDELAELPALAAELERWSTRAELAVVDGGSSDGTRAALDRLGVRVLDAPRGRARQMNAGARATAAPILLFLHADTRLPEGAVDAVCAAVDGGAAGGCFRVRIDSRDPRLRWPRTSSTCARGCGPRPPATRRSSSAATSSTRSAATASSPCARTSTSYAGSAARAASSWPTGEVATSARRWHGHGVMRTIALMWTLRLGYHLGVSPDLLARWYRHAR